MIYILDEDMATGRRVWSDFVWDFERCHVSSSLRGDSICPRVPDGEILVCHDLSQSAAKLVHACAKRGVLVIIVNAGGGQGWSNDGLIYHRKLPVSKPVDHAFGVCLAAFARHLAEKKQADWTLLEGPPAPAALMAYHLLGLLEGDDRPKDLEQTALEEAKAEVTEIARATSIEPIKDLHDREQRRQFLQNFFVGK